MNKFRFYSVTLYCLLAAIGCAENPHSVTPAPNPTPPTADPVVAAVNNQTIHQSELLRLLYPGPGRKVLDELIQFHLIRQYAQKKGVTLTDDMIRNQHQQILDDMAPGKTPAQQERMLSYILESRGLSRPQFDLIVKQQALAAALVDSHVDITETMLRNEYEYLHGRKIQIRLLAAASSRKIEDAQRRFNAGEDFIHLVRTLSEDQTSLERDGLIGPFTKDDQSVPVTIRNAAFALDSPGRFSDIIQYRNGSLLEYYGWFKIEQIIPADNTNFEQVKKDLKKSIERKTIQQRIIDLQKKIRKEAKIEITEPLLMPRNQSSWR